MSSHISHLISFHPTTKLPRACVLKLWGGGIFNYLVATVVNRGPGQMQWGKMMNTRRLDSRIELGIGILFKGSFYWLSDFKSFILFEETSTANSTAVRQRASQRALCSAADCCRMNRN